MTDAAASQLIAAVANLGARERCQMINLLEPFPGADVVRLGTDVASQADGTTCGSAVLGVLLAATDPHLAYWLITGAKIDGSVPTCLAGSDGADLAGGGGHRWRALQLMLKQNTNSLALLGVLPWPHGLGTPPWGLARVATASGIPLRMRLVNDSAHDDRLAQTLDELLTVQPLIPAYVGQAVWGVGRLFWWAVMPRHVVLIAAGSDGGYRVYEPSTGRVVPLGRDEIHSRRSHPRRLRAYGAWSRLIVLVGPQTG